jgi:hypothetical protein
MLISLHQKSSSTKCQQSINNFACSILKSPNAMLQLLLMLEVLPAGIIANMVQVDVASRHDDHPPISNSATVEDSQSIN